jgi:hypothetical protein
MKLQSTWFGRTGSRETGGAHRSAERTGEDIEEGAVYIYSYVIDGWDFQDRVEAPGPGQSAWLGSGVAISGDFALAGAPGTEVDGVPRAGAAYAFQSSGSDWDSVAPARLTAPDPVSEDWYGWSVAVHNDFVLVGCFMSDVFAQDAGAVYLYGLNTGNSWNLVDIISTDTPASGDNLGMDVAVNADYAVVGATDLNNSPESGAVYVFK